uniref:Uncharacterized protein n=1 Tax=Anguilla anguilla TaxID=7936 RepID=A0A0E9PEC1_ANGAN
MPAWRGTCQLLRSDTRAGTPQVSQGHCTRLQYWSWPGEGSPFPPGRCPSGP